jgi:hypothetical protein
VAREASKQSGQVEQPKRESGTSPVRRDAALSKPPPPLPQAKGFEPLSLGANAFAPPMFSASTAEDEPSRLRKAMPWLALTGVAAISGVAVWIAMVASKPPSKDAEKAAAEERAAAEHEASPSAAEEAQPEAEPIAAAEPAQDAVMPLPNPPSQPAAQAAQPAAEAGDEAKKEDDDKGRSAERDEAREKRHAARAAKAAAAAATSKLPEAPSRGDVLAAMAGVHAAVVRCMDGAHGVVTADMKILGTGRVASANISGAPAQAGSCIAGAVRKARFPEFSTPSIAVRYPMKL